MGYELNTVDAISDRIMLFAPQEKETLKALEEEFLSDQLERNNDRLSALEARQLERHSDDELVSEHITMTQIYMRRQTLLTALQIETQDRLLIAAIRKRLKSARRDDWGPSVLRTYADKRQEHWIARVDNQLLVSVMREWEAWLASHLKTDKEL